MANLNKETPNNYIANLSEEEKTAFLKILFNLAHSDGHLDDSEKSMIYDTAAIMGISDAKAAEILVKVEDDVLIKDAAKIKSRQAALHLIKEACLLANCDKDFSEQEIVLIGKIGQAMGVELEKIEQISQWVIDRLIWLDQGKVIFEQL